MTLIQFDPPKAHGNKITQDHYWVEPKLDGIRAIVHIHPEHGIVITTRRKNLQGEYSQLQDKLPHLRDNKGLEMFALGGYTILDAELVLPGKKAADMMSIVGADPALAINYQKTNGAAKLALFDCVRDRDADLTNFALSDRKEILEHIVANFEIPGLLVKHTLLTGDLVQGRSDYMERCLAAGYEGMMLKNPGAPYHSTQWRKQKERETHDLQVVGWQPGKGKYSGMIGALVVAWPNGRTACAVAPGSDSDRARLSDQLMPLDEGQIRVMDLWVEVECQEVTPDQSLRHPRIVGWRKDLSLYSKAGYDGTNS